MKLRKLLKSDYEQWLILWKGYQNFYKVSIDQKITDKTFNRLLCSEEDMNCLVIEKNKKIIAFVHFIFHKSTWTEGDYCYLQDLFVAPSERSQGYGKKLIEEVYTKAEENSCSRVYWLTHETNYPGRTLYDTVAENAGFIQYRKNLG